MPHDPDDDQLDHPESLVDDADDEQTATLRPLFPDGVPSDRWEGLF